MKDIKLRIKSVESTMQITKAMELVASSKMRRAKERVSQSRPYFEVLHKTLVDIAASNTEFQSPYTKTREIKKTLLIVIAGDRGLAGGYNSNVLKLASAQEGDVCVLPIGKRSLDYFLHRGVEVVSSDFDIASELNVASCFRVAKLVSKGFCKGEYDAVKICYTQFTSMMTQTASVMPILPLTLEITEEHRQASRKDVILYEPNSEEVFNSIIPEYVAGIVYSALCESLASELAARRTAMDAATKNAGAMIESLNLYYNRARQAAITQEITEIVAGAEH